MIALNCDMGEGCGVWKMGRDDEIMPHIDMANIACGFHASDPFIMTRTVQLAKQQGVSIGAHPAYPDIIGFGRRDMTFSVDEIRDLVIYQVGALQAICHSNDTTLDYVKPHGALYHRMMNDPEVLLAIMQAIVSLPARLFLVVFANSRANAIREMAASFGLPIFFEAFCDRAYGDDGNLVSRQVEGAVLTDDNSIASRVHELINEKSVTTISGNKILINADTVCVHSDSPRAVESVKKIRQIVRQL